MALDSLSATLSCQLSATGARNITGDDYSPLTQTVSLKGSTRLGTAAANDAANGADECVSFILTVDPSDTGQIDLTDLTDIIGQSSVSLAHVKGVLFRLLSTTDDPDNGTACNSVSIYPDASSGWSTGPLQNAAIGGSEILLKNGEWFGWATPAAAGAAVSGANLIDILNNDGTHTAAVQVTIIGGTT